MADSELIEKPTYMEDIRYFFEAEDIAHMRQLGIELGTYESVKEKAASIYVQTLQPGGRMPPDPARRWTEARSQTFLNWINLGMPRGVSNVSEMATAALADPNERVRKNLSTLDKDESESLVECFTEMMKKNPDDPTSYFHVASIHWFPPPMSCLHHEPRYNSWHRAYLRVFEDAMRTIPGCETITLPYWDILSPIPDILQQPPLDKYKLQREAAASWPAGHETERYNLQTIYDNITDRDIASTIASALSTDVWEEFNDYIIGAHDDGHVSCGDTLRRQEIASFDPLFWFFHCNWDRLWWKWQVAADAIDYEKFKNTVRNSSTLMFFESPINEITPFDTTSDEEISIKGLRYIHPDGEAPVSFNPPVLMSSHSAPQFRIAQEDRVRVKVTGLNRMLIRGSFTVHLRADGDTLKRASFFQPFDPSTCDTCKKNSLVDFQFDVSRTELSEKSLSIQVEVADEEQRVAEFIPVAFVGNPKMEILTLFSTE